MEQLPDVELTADQREMPPDWLKKDTQARIAESLLKAIDPNVSIEWVQGDDSKLSARRVIQMSG